MERRRTIAALAAGMLLLGLAIAPLAKERRLDPKEGFRRLLAATTPDGNAAHPEAWPASLVERRDWRCTPEQVDAWRREGIARLSATTIRKVRELGDRAYVWVAGPAGEAVVPLRWNADHWELAAPTEWLVKGDALDAANGKEPASVRLTRRTASGPYGTSAFSFAHATQDPEPCLNRMDVWTCHNDDLHVLGDGRIVDLGRKRLSGVKDLPLDARDWSRTAPAQKGHAYVVHCVRPGQRDFFVALRLEAISPEGFEMSWNLLSLGEGAPASIHAPQPWTPIDDGMGLPGADACAGLCGRNR